MKKTICLLILMMATTGHAAGELNTNQISSKTPDFQLMPVIGSSAFNIKGLGGDLSDRNGFTLGLLGQWATPIDKLQFESGIEYVQAGATLSYIYVATGKPAFDIEYMTDYLMIPLRARYQLNDEPLAGFNYHIKGGISPATLVTAEAKTTMGTSSQTKDIKSKFNGTDVFASAAFSGETAALGGKVNFELEYARGMQGVLKDEGGYNEGYIIRAGYALVL